MWGPRAVGSLVPGLTRPAFRRRSPATAQIMTDWAAIVGPALAAVTVPRRLSGTTLTLACAGPIAMELQHMTGELIARINGHLGRVVVDRLRFVQEALPAPGRAGGTTAPGPAPARIAGLPDGPLHDALARLGQAVRRRGPAKVIRRPGHTAANRATAYTPCSTPRVRTIAQAGDRWHDRSAQARGRGFNQGVHGRS